MMVGEFLDDERNDSRADHRLMREKYISIVADNIDSTDYQEEKRISNLGFDVDF